MASRLLLSSLSRAKTAPPRLGFQFSRSLATATSAAPSQPKTQTTVLPSGLTVATESFPGAPTATVGVWIDAGSRAESASNNGAAHFLEHMAFKGTANRSREDIEIQIENMGAHLNAYTSREQTVYYAKAFQSDVPQCVEILSDILQNSKLDASAIERERGVILREQEEVNKVMEEVVFDHLHATAFQGHSLGRTILGSEHNIRSLQRDELASYIRSQYAADRMVLVGTGGIEHDALVRLAEQHFATLPRSLTPAAHIKPHFSGSDLRVRNDTLPAAHIALAVEGVGWNHPDYYSLLVLQSVVGSWDRSLGAAPNVSSRLAAAVHEHNLANSFMSFNTSYSDTGLWGIYAVSENKLQLDDLIYNIQKEWARLSVSVTDAEVLRAKQQLKAALLLQLDGSTAVAEDLGRQLVTTGKRVEPAEMERLVDAVSTKDVRRVASNYLWDKDVAVVGVGPIESLTDYTRLRGAMSWNRF
ncbi:Metalloenzyme, LuxS/M16 peptidase-like protein [Piptocephalis cylindrospora]|uniref:mitochondrial processing peptidase n=1 Tax=Piptocephalis cylindrospora TaxID=1907219 RepID=A0A4P9Y5S3_9FUNG|nr:Metalloenzyme, LuxS/M16 peptidase-like protein [Piptocephalis cylindrospora]|eukprot:RKP13160.1 Metalloenzyme, LuxS/M16 peptidase-like protein [Piptocephalis cylindrospora]